MGLFLPDVFVSKIALMGLLTFHRKSFGFSIRAPGASVLTDQGAASGYSPP